MIACGPGNNGVPDDVRRPPGGYGPGWLGAGRHFANSRSLFALSQRDAPHVWMSGTRRCFLPWSHSAALVDGSAPPIWRRGAQPRAIALTVEIGWSLGHGLVRGRSSAGGGGRMGCLGALICGVRNDMTIVQC